MSVLKFVIAAACIVALTSAAMQGACRNVWLDPQCTFGNFARICNCFDMDTPQNYGFVKAMGYSCLNATTVMRRLFTKAGCNDADDIGAEANEYYTIGECSNVTGYYSSFNCNPSTTAMASASLIACALVIAKLF
eukprot:TRINITY_DN11979_c0_g1_i1.p1 TRINITY_DN11979_c0_g1~~TRINITY_DN11979_c0_g1_i1.p1  ORF type:complete len:135 (+),score=15.46 TRINITY_DN11979_c0_g1_i1:62-466(+)